MNNNCVLTFYEVADSIPIDAEKASAIEVFEQVMSLDSGKRSCKNVYRFTMSPNQLAKQLKNPSKCSKALVDDIAKELESGANYMFVQPVVGVPLLGMKIHDFLAKSGKAQTAKKVKNKPLTFVPKPAKDLQSKYFDIDSWGLAGGDNQPSWAFNYLNKNGYLSIFEVVVKSRRHEFLSDYREKSQDLKLDCLMFNKRGQIAFKWNSEQDKMAFILKWS